MRRRTGPSATIGAMLLRPNRGEGEGASRRGVALITGALALAAVVVVIVLRSSAGDEGGAPRVDPARAGVVAVIAASPTLRGGGSGFVFDASEGLVATNFHVINGGTDFSVVVDGRARGADIVGAAPCEDLAVLRVRDRAGLREVRLGDRPTLTAGARVLAVGFPGVPAVAPRRAETPGTVSTVDTALAAGGGTLRHPGARFLPDYASMIETDAALLSGYSGGPLLDAGGRVVGVNTVIATAAPATPQETRSYAIGIDRATEVIGVLRTGESRAWFGTGLVFPSRSARRRTGRPSGVVAAPVVTGALPERRGRLLVTAIDGERLAGGFPGYCRATAEVESGESATLDAITLDNGERMRLVVPFE